MEEKRYKVLIDNIVVAQGMDIKIAMVLVRALFEEYYNDYAMTISIEQEDKALADC